MVLKQIVAVALILLIAGVSIPAAGAQADAGMLRYPDVSADRIAFIHGGNLWTVPREGGIATILAGPPSRVQHPCFSPDGQTIAFQTNYDGNRDIYTTPVAGGVPFRVTHHPAAETPWDWTNDGRLLFSCRGMGPHPLADELFTVPARGGLPEQVAVPYGTGASISPDGSWLAYTNPTRDFDTRKRYRGGGAPDIWLFQLDHHESRRITDWEGTDTRPMWHGDLLYYLSDAGPEHRLNLWAYDLRTAERRQVTHFVDYDVRCPSAGPADIVFQRGAELHLLDLATEETRKVRITIPGDHPGIRTETRDVAGDILSQHLSPTGKRVVVEARGDIWTLPAGSGSPRNLTRTAGVAERFPAWSPDGQWIACFSDASGDYELQVIAADGRGEARVLTEMHLGLPEDIVWSPDARRIAFWDLGGALHVCDVDAARTQVVYRSSGMRRPRVNWAPDSNWLTFADRENSRRSTAVWIYDVRGHSVQRVTAGMYSDSWPTFDRSGRYLFFASQRDFTCPVNDDLTDSWIYSDTDRLYVVPLQAGDPSPLLPRSDEEPRGESAADPVQIDFDDFEQRAVALPVDPGAFGYLAVNDAGDLLYARYPSRGADGTRSILLFDMDQQTHQTVLEGASAFTISADGKKLLNDGGAMAILDARPDQSAGCEVPTGGMLVTIDPREEWRQLFTEAWRLERDYFYDPGMHGVDWDAVRERYAVMLDSCASRDDVAFVIREMLGELAVSHTSYRPRDREAGPEVSVGMLGCDYELHQGAFRIARIYQGAAWDVGDRGPLSQPGVDVAEGDYLLAVNGVPLGPDRDPWIACQGLAGRTVTLTVGDRPRHDDSARDVVIELLADDSDLRFRAWVERNRTYVEDRTDGRVGYIYVRNTYIRGQNDLMRQFWSQRDKEALIIDERWNDGGNLGDRFVELLNRPVSHYWPLRYGENQVLPASAHHGPKCMLINGIAGSGGDHFPYLFRKRGLGKLIGTRTLGGLVSIYRRFTMIDGTHIVAPALGFLEPDGTWGIENHGVDPDIEVVDDPARHADGREPQLDAAIEHMLAEIQRNPYRAPDRPAYPDRSGWGVEPEDR